MHGYSQVAYIRHGADEPVAVRIFAGFDGTVHISEGWMSFVESNFLVCGNECLLRFDRFGKSLTIVIYDF